MTETVQVFPVGWSGAYALEVAGSQRLWKYYHEAYCITLVSKGFAYWRYRTRDSEVKPEGLMLMEPGEVHANTKVVEAGDFFAVFISPAQIERFFEGSTKPVHFKTELLSDDHAIAHMQRLRWVTQNDGADAQEEQLALTLRSVMQSAAEEPTAGTIVCPKKLRKGKESLAERYRAQPWRTVDIEEVAAETGLSYHWFVHAFSEQFAVAPYQYVKALRMARVRELMAAGPNTQLQSVRDIALATGYADASHMNREFKQDHGVRPGLLAKALHPGWRGGVRRVVKLGG